MSILHERYAPNADTGEEMLTHAGEEGGVIVKGKIELTVGGESRILGPGRCLLLQELPAASVPQYRPRGMRNRQREFAADVLIHPYGRYPAPSGSIAL